VHFFPFLDNPTDVLLRAIMIVDFEFMKIITEKKSRIIVRLNVYCTCCVHPVDKLVNS
jgi:hypothetical protein